MHSDRYVFDKAREITAKAGYLVPIQEIDVFSTSEKTVDFEDHGLSLSWYKALAISSDGKIHDSERIEIYEEDDDTPYDDELTMVFQGMKVPSGELLTYYYLPGKWVDALEKIAQQVSVTR